MGTKAISGKTPFEMLYGKRPDLCDLWEWGEECWVLNEGGDKLDLRAKKGHWLGFDEHSNGMWILYPDTGTVHVEYNVTFRDPNLEGEERPVSEIWHTQSNIPSSHTPLNIKNVVSTSPSPTEDTTTTPANLFPTATFQTGA